MSGNFLFVPKGPNPYPCYFSFDVGHTGVYTGTLISNAVG